VPVLSTAIGWPATRFAGEIGRLARENTRRNPQRTASTAAALMIGLALVTLVAMLSAGLIANFKDSVNQLFTGDYAITAQNNNSPIPVAAGEAALRAPGALAVGDVRAGEGRAFGHNEQLTAVDPGIEQVMRLQWTRGAQGVLGSLGTEGAFTTDSYADKHHLDLGSPIAVTTPTGAQIPLIVRGIFKPPSGGSPFGSITMSAATWDRFYRPPENLYSLVKMSGGETAANQAALDRTLAQFPDAKVQTRQKFIDNQIAGLSSVLNILYVLLALSIVVSLFGIVNTLVLSVFERTREIGMLRAMGTTRRQVRRMVRHESVITALIGSVIGVALGVVFGALLAARVSAIAFTIPVGSLIVFLLASWLVGLLAAIFPARRASRLQPLEALAYE
jgi:ABC-type antimicrobial peptide transport system permease subunit